MKAQWNIRHHTQAIHSECHPPTIYEGLTLDYFISCLRSIFLVTWSKLFSFMSPDKISHYPEHVYYNSTTQRRTTIFSPDISCNQNHLSLELFQQIISALSPKPSNLLRSMLSRKAFWFSRNNNVTVHRIVCIYQPHTYFQHLENIFDSAYLTGDESSSKSSGKVYFFTHGAWWMTLDFSSRYSEIWAPMTVPPLVNLSSKYLPNLLELLLITVQAFPNASSRLFTSRIFSCSTLLLVCKI